MTPKEALDTLMYGKNIPFAVKQEAYLTLYSIIYALAAIGNEIKKIKEASKNE